MLGAKGGTIVFSGRGYMGGSYTFPKQSSPLYITAVAPDGTDYRYTDAAAALDDRTGTLSIREGLTLTLQSDFCQAAQLPPRSRQPGVLSLPSAKV